MDNHGCKGCLTPSLCITYPRTQNISKVFPVLLPFQLDKIKVGGDSCYPHISNKVSSPYYNVVLIMYGVNWMIKMCYKCVTCACGCYFDVIIHLGANWYGLGSIRC